MSATLRVRCTLLLFVLCCLQPSSPWLFQAAPPPTRLLRLLPFPSRPFPGRGIGSGMFSAGGGPARAFLAGSLQPMVTDRLTPLASTAPAAIAGGVKGAIGTSRRALRVADVLTSSAVFIYRWRRANALSARDAACGSQAHSGIARDMMKKFVKLGPTYIKLGQLLSTRPDIVSKAYADVFLDLQDRVPPFSSDLAVLMIEKELGGPIDQLFSDFNRTPIASASIGQVHIAEANGTRVAVKVQRPGVRKLFDLDLDILKVLVGALGIFYSKIDGVAFDWKALFEEYIDVMYKELDYRREGLQGIKFRNNFADVPWVTVPQVLMNMSTSRVLTMEYIPGIKITDVDAIANAGLDRKVLANRLAESYLLQLFKHGFFHCDPHAGNLACDQGGRLIYYDFGMMSDISSEMRHNFASLVIAMYENNVQGVYTAFNKLGVIDEDANQSDIIKVLTVFLAEFNSLVYTSSGVYTTKLPKEEQDLLVRKRKLKLGAELWVKLQNEGLFKVPSTFTFITRAFNILDGVGKALDPMYDLFKITQPFVSELVQIETGMSNFEIQFWGSRIGRFLLSLGVRRRTPLVKLECAINEPAPKSDRDHVMRAVSTNSVNIRRILKQQQRLTLFIVSQTLLSLYSNLDNFILNYSLIFGKAGHRLQSAALAGTVAKALLGILREEIAPRK